MACEWDVDRACCSVTLPTLGDTPTADEQAAYDAALATQNAAEDTAVHILWSLSGRQFGVCDATARPCPTSWVSARRSGGQDRRISTTASAARPQTPRNHNKPLAYARIAPPGNRLCPNGTFGAIQDAMRATSRYRPLVAGLLLAAVSIFAGVLAAAVGLRIGRTIMDVPGEVEPVEDAE